MSAFRVIFQHEQEDCGAACLTMIIRYYGFHGSMEAIKCFCGNMKNGTTLYGLNKAAQRMGFSTQAVRLNNAELHNLGQTVLPFIAHWQQNHFVVVYKTTNSNVYVADPAIGRIRYSYQEFSDGFLSSESGDGFALLLFPEDIRPDAFLQKERDGLKLIDYIKPHWRQLVYGLFALIILAAIGLVSPFLTRAIVDVGIAEKNPGVLFTILCATLALAIGRCLFSFLQSRMALIAGTMMDINLANDLLLRLSNLPMKFFVARKVGDMIQRVSDVSRIGDFFSSRVSDSLLSIVMFCIYGGLLLHLYPILFLVFMSGALIYIIYILHFLRQRKILDYEFFRASSKSQEELIQYLRGMTELRIASAEKERLALWRNLRHELFGTSRRSMVLSQKQEFGSVLIFQVVDAVTIFLMAHAVIAGNTTLGSMMAVQYIVGSMESPLHIVTNFISEAQNMRIALSRVNYIASAEPERKGGATVDFSDKAPSICLTHVSFSYDIDIQRPALQDVSTIIPAGKTTALVGMSGSGKTTFLKLLLGFYSPDEGTISINDKPFGELSLNSWRKNVGVVMQDGYIFSDTILYNVALGDDNPSAAHVYEALRIACADFVYELPNGLQTIIGGEGMSLSSGQRQRILLARAIYKHPAVFFLDEATNALDAINERRIYNNLYTELKGKTVVIAAHRLSTIRNADQILVFEEGQIVENGTHEDLLKLNGKYAELVENQRFK